MKNDHQQTRASPSSDRERRLAHKAPLGRAGEGTLQWSAGGFFGSQLGATLWIALLGGLLVPLEPLLGLGILALCLLANALGLGLWRRRATLAPHTAIQLLCLASLGAAAATLFLLDAVGISELAEAELGDGRPLWTYLLVYPLVMLLLWWLDRRGRDARA
jgi:hypothetical protein